MGQDYKHRRQWMEDRIFFGEASCIDVCTYVVMSNHHYGVLYINTTLYLI